VTTGFLIVDKPVGLTSHDVVARVRRATGVRRVGHAGTLDPMATGVVVVAVGSVTRLIRFVQDQDKEYEATARFGVATDTLDADGEEIDRTPMSVDMASLREIGPRFVGEILQVPPMVSALKRDGTRLYELARRGVEVEREARPVVVHELEFVSVSDEEYPLVAFRVVCGKGTYVRSLADDIARAAGGFAHLTALRRTRSGPFHVADAIDVEGLESWSDRLISPVEALSFLPTLAVDAETARMVGNGRPIPAGSVTGSARVIGQDGALLAVYSCADGTGRPEVVLA
jgi:tRNA pseudouridine55 synthase